MSGVFDLAPYYLLVYSRGCLFFFLARHVTTPQPRRHVYLIFGTGALREGTRADCFSSIGPPTSEPLLFKVWWVVGCEHTNAGGGGGGWGVEMVQCRGSAYAYEIFV